MRRLLVTVVALLFGVAVAAQARPTPTRVQRCELAKLAAAAQYQSCRLMVQRRALLRSVTADFTPCDLAYSKRWTQAETTYGVACPTLGDQASIGGAVAARSGTVALRLTGASVPDCGDGIKNGNEQCDSADLGGASCKSLGYTRGGALACTAACQYDATGCASQRLPASGQMTPYPADRADDDVPSEVSVPDDGVLQRGAPLQYADNGDGTITDLNTGLMWEKKGDDDGLHDRDNRYYWSGDGTQDTIWDWLDAINSEGGTGFAGYSDWRIPNTKELHSLVDFEKVSFPMINGVFDTDCVSGCSVTTCSCIGNEVYWTSTTQRRLGEAWYVAFFDGTLNSFGKGVYGLAVRAVRGGL